MPKFFVFPGFIESLLRAIQAWLSTNTSQGILDIMPETLDMRSI